ncbi:MAG TPA: LysM peptidoglycan-binding domain-containing protein [Gaiellales bacterium]|jgi:nucleoid-associated protein YgaU|nr:LysM peptidoglycan-binding domain-containing protein [Gaiellales bacterium]
MFDPSPTRRLLTLLAVAACTLAAVLGEAAPSRGASPPRHHRVTAGETLWSIAERAYPRSDPREAVDTIAHANHLDGATIAVGEELTLP